MNDQRASPSGGYTDPSPPAASTPGLLVPIVAGVAAAAAGPFLWVGLYSTIQNEWMPPLLIGAIVGLTMRLTSRTPDRRLSIAAAIATVVACYAGFVWADLGFKQWTLNGAPVQPTIGDATKRFFNNLVMIILIAIGAYISFSVASRSTSSGGN